MVREKSDTPDQWASTEMQIYEALRRREMAYAFADMMEWTVHERYISQLFQHLRKEPPQGYMKTSIQQLLRAWCGHCFTHHIVGGLSTALFKLWEYLSREATLQPCTCRSPWNAFRGGKERRLGCFQGRRLDPEHVTPKKRSCQWQDCCMRYF